MLYSLLFLQFTIVTAIIVFAGTNLSKYGDIIAAKMGLGRTLIGMTLIAFVTSLPELITGVSSVVLDLPDIAAGDVLGSCMFNVVIIAILDSTDRKFPISARAQQGQVLGAAFGVAALGLVSIGIVAGRVIPAIGWIGLYSLALVGIYFVAVRLTFLYERRGIAELVEVMAEKVAHDEITRARAFFIFGINAVIIVGAAAYLPHLGESIAEVTGLGQTFVGNMFIALSTSLPELVVSIAALRIGAVDIVFGNIFGSNLFNLLILAIDDAFYIQGPLLERISAHHVISANGAMAMTAIAIVGLTYRAERKRLYFGWDSLGIVGVYVLTGLLLYAMR